MFLITNFENQNTVEDYLRTSGLNNHPAEKNVFACFDASGLTVNNSITYIYFLIRHVNYHLSQKKTLRTLSCIFQFQVN